MGNSSQCNYKVCYDYFRKDDAMIVRCYIFNIWKEGGKNCRNSKAEIRADNYFMANFSYVEDTELCHNMNISLNEEAVWQSRQLHCLSEAEAFYMS